MKKMNTLSVNGNSYVLEDAGAVAFDRAQALTDEQKLCARQNMDACRADDTNLGEDTWSSANTVDKLCPSFEERGSMVRCEPVEGYPLAVVSHLGGERNSATLIHCGKNFYDKNAYPLQESQWINKNVGNLVTGSSTCYCTPDYIPISHLRGMTITLNHPPGGSSPGMAFYDADKVYISGGKGTAIKVPDTAEYMRFTVDGVYGDGTDVQWEIGATATAYAAYNGHTYTADFGKTVSGGTYDWASGVLTDENGNETRLTPQRIPALDGMNTLCSDTGETAVKGKADPRAVMEKLTNAIIALGGNI